VNIRIPYRKYPDVAGGYFHVASIPLSISALGNTSRSKRVEAIIDSGASRCVFQASLGRAIGLEIEKGKLVEVLGIAGPEKIYLHNVTLHAPGGPLEIIAGFSEKLPVLALLGMDGFFDNYKIIFDPSTHCCELERIHKA